MRMISVHRILVVVSLALGLGVATPLAAAPNRLVVLPEIVTLRGPHDSHRIVALLERADGSRVDVTESVMLASDDAAIARIGAIDDETRPAVMAAGDGTTTIRLSASGLSAALPVTVTDVASVKPPSFVHDVMATLTRAGCNSGPCHGSQHGRGGFKLSLLGYEAEPDYLAIVHEARGRRVGHDAASSLIVVKPLTAVPHEGGRRIEEGSTAHRILERWIAAGAPGPSKNDPVVTRIDVLPARRTLATGEAAYFLAVARLSDGTSEDVTGKALFSSLNDGIAAVDPSARVVAGSAGETAIMVRYQGQASILRVTVPYRALEEDAIAKAGFEAMNFIDEIVSRKWRDLGLLPSGLCSDGEFMRRVFVTAIGTLPTAGEVRAFLSDESPDKRNRLIETVLQRPEYVDYWTLKWGDLLRIDRGKMNEKGMWSMFNWVRGKLRENAPLDVMVRELITAQGSTYTSGPTNYYRVAQRPNDLAETTSQVFLGIRLQCAQCHHHPFEKWSQDDYYGLAAYFARLGIKSSSEFGVYGREQVVYVKKSGEVRHPKTGRVVPPTPFESEPRDDATDRRRALAAWLTSKDNALFAHNFANRLWAYVMGRGVVDPIDDIRVTNPASMPKLFDALADELVSSDFDVKHTLKTIMRSRVFQLSSRTRPENKRDEMFYSHYLVRRLPAEVLLDGIVAVTGVPESFSGLPAGTRAIQLPDAEVKSYFLESFGKPKRAIACECERVSLPNMAQALHLLNGDFIQKRVANPKGRVAKAVASKRADGELVDELYRATFARSPTKAELDNALRFIGEAGSRKEGYEDLLWALLSSSEFVFNH